MQTEKLNNPKIHKNPTPYKVQVPTKTRIPKRFHTLNPRSPKPAQP